MKGIQLLSEKGAYGISGDVTRIKRAIIERGPVLALFSLHD
jgi:hypothetical protein